nr:selection and upkeep of intraepithelial T-cells protein 8-like isoform X2 [Meriones unguiculatus]
MKPTYSYFSGYHACLIFLQAITLTLENLTVTTPPGHVEARVGGQAELSCQVTPPPSVEDMEVRWFRDDESKLVYQYRGGRGENGEAAPEYGNRVEFVKEAIGKGKVALRIHNISISDDGPYQCSFNDDGFSDVAFMKLHVAVSFSDPLFSLYNKWMVNMAIVVAFLVTIFTVTTIALLLIHITIKKNKEYTKQK